MIGDTPKHIAIVMDGNGRWAERLGYPRAYGHVRGTVRVKETVQDAHRLGIKALTLYAFSTENWARPEEERKVLWKLLKKYLLKQADELNRNNVKLRVVGELHRLDLDIQEVVTATIHQLRHNTGLQLTFAISYGSRWELAQAARLFAEDCISGKTSPTVMNEKTLENYLWSSDLGELSKVDLFIRTSGEQRISNFMLWQSAYAELVFVDICWPEFKRRHLEEAIREYTGRERRFGRIQTTKPSALVNGFLVQT